MFALAKHFISGLKIVRTYPIYRLMPINTSPRVHLSIGSVSDDCNITLMSHMCNTSEQYFIIQMRFIIDRKEVMVMSINERIRLLMDERNWTEYRMAKEAGLSQSTVANLFNRNTVPSVSTLEAICGGFGITLAQFFSEGNIV
jgi:DNA-binding XRE family transcriptional regulator